jgi:hypothetical protein
MSLQVELENVLPLPAQSLCLVARLVVALGVETIRDMYVIRVSKLNVTKWLE